MKRSLLLSISASLLLLVCAQVGAGQNSHAAKGEVEGAVIDFDGGVVVGALVQLIAPPSATVRTTETEGDGRFRFRGVPVGSYEVLVTRAGFAEARRGVRVTSSESTDVRVVLEVGALANEVTVTAETGQVTDTDRVAQQVNVIGERTLAQRTTAVLAQVAEEEPGVALQRTSPNVGAIVVRGLTEVGVYVDGVRFTQSTQRGGINTFFNLNEPTSLREVEILRGTSSAQYGSESLGGVVQLISESPPLGTAAPATHGEVRTQFNSADLSFGASTLVTYGAERYGILANLAARRLNTLRPGGGFDSHAAVTRFLGLPSTVFGTRLTDTAFTQYSGTIKFNYAPRDDQQIIFSYQRSQQDGAKRYDQTLGGDGNLIADLRNLQLDFAYARYLKQRAGFFDSASATLSFNRQREERVNQGGQGNPLAGVTHDKERTRSVGFSFQLDKQSTSRNTFLFGGDIYRDVVAAPSFSFDPQTNRTTITRPRVPNGARYILAGLFAQDAYEVFADRLRLSGALRYNVASYRSQAENSPLVGGQPLFPDDSLRIADFSGRAGAVITIAPGLYGVFNYSRGFRAPNVTDLGSVGLVGVGFQVAANELIGSGATIGTTAGADAVSTNLPIERLRSQTSNNFDFGINTRLGGDRFRAGFTVFRINYHDVIARQTLILPPGAIGLRLGSETITQQLASGAVFVEASPNPVLVQVNFGEARVAGVESEFELRITERWSADGNFTFIRAEDPETNLPPNLGGGGIPPALGFLRLRYAPSRRFFVEASTNLAGRQTRLSSLDLNDRRTGAIRTRQNIQNFFRRGACVRGLTTPGASGQCGSAGGILISTGETLAEVQRRVLGAQESAPLFAAIPGYGLINLRGGVRLGERTELEVDFENIGDKNYRQPGWGVDGPGRSVAVRYRYRF